MVIGWKSVVELAGGVSWLQGYAGQVRVLRYRMYVKTHLASFTRRRTRDVLCEYSKKLNKGRDPARAGEGSMGYGVWIVVAWYLRYGTLGMVVHKEIEIRRESSWWVFVEDLWDGVDSTLLVH